MTGERGASLPAGVEEELLRLYRDFDEATARVSPVCRASGRCCDFDAFGHTLFSSRLEAELLAREAPPPEPARAGFCPWWVDRKCTARGPRPLGCRAFFCDASKADAMAALHEEFLRRLKDLHDRRGIPWSYAPMLRHLDGIAAGPGPSP